MNCYQKTTPNMSYQKTSMVRYKRKDYFINEKKTNKTFHLHFDRNFSYIHFVNQLRVFFQAYLDTEFYEKFMYMHKKENIGNKHGF